MPQKKKPLPDQGELPVWERWTKDDNQHATRHHLKMLKGWRYDRDTPPEQVAEFKRQALARVRLMV